MAINDDDSIVVGEFDLAESENFEAILDELGELNLHYMIHHHDFWRRMLIDHMGLLHTP